MACKKLTGGMKSHQGRLLAVKGRFSKKWTASMLPTRNSKAKRGSGGPESLAEVRGPRAHAMGKGTALAPDGAQAFHSAAAEIGVPSLPGVNHQDKVFTPVTRLLKSKLPKRTAAALRRHSRGKAPAVQETKLYFKLVAGDNSVESVQGRIRNTLRRVGNVGRHNASETKKAVQTLSGAALLRRAGVASVLDALRRYRVALSAGVVQMTPRESFRAESCVWAVAEEKGEAS